MYSGTLTIETTDGKKMSEIEFETGSKWAANTADVGTLNGKKWSGDADKVVFTIAGNSQMKSITVKIAGTVTTYTDVNSVEDLLKNYTAAKENLNLKLTNAKVTYVNTYVDKSNNTIVNAYVRDGNSAIELRTLGIETPVNSLLNGSVKVDLKFSYGVPYLVANDGTSADDLTVTASEEAAEPIEATVADILDNKYINDLVTIKNFTFEKDEYQEGKYNYYAKDGDKKIQLYDKFDKVGGVANLTDGETYTVTGIFGAIYNKTNIPEIIPVKAIDESATAIDTIEQAPATTNAATYNIAGQRVDKSYKGIVIVNGKKHIQ